MRRQVIILVCIGVVFCLAGGCWQEGAKISSPSQPDNQIQPALSEPVLSEVEMVKPQKGPNEPVAQTANKVWDGTAPAQDALPDFFPDKAQTSEFPKSMVGVWEILMYEATGSKWGIKFEPDGSIKKIIHLVAGPVKIDKGGIEANGPDEGTYYTFVMGPCEARYIPDTNTIKVKIIADYFMMKFSAGELEGRIEDYFEGPVSGDGKTWNVKWWNFGWLKGAAMPDINGIKTNPEPLVFNKVEERPKVTADSNLQIGLVEHKRVERQPKIPTDSNMPAR